MKKEFPANFEFGTATSAYQIEGAATEDGRGPSVWDMFCDKPGAVLGGHDGSVASDHYHRLEEDVGLLRQLGVDGYRFSISWPRVLPEGTGKVNAKGLDFYDRLVDALLDAGIAPFATLFHWDMPLALYHRGGWLNRSSADWFADYARIVAEKLGDRVKRWATLNEPQVFIGLGHYDGRHAPGVRYSLAEMLRCGHHALLAHGKSAQAVRAALGDSAKIGYAPVGCPKVPASESPRDLEALRQAMFAITARNQWSLTWWTDPVIFGRYPEDGLELFGADCPLVLAGDMETICQPTDFLGLNLYQAPVIEAGDAGPREVPHPPGGPLTAFNWPVTPAALYWGPRLAYERYGKPIVVTENGLSLRDWPSLDGCVHDPQRIDFITRHLRQLHRAIEDGIPVEGYYHWSAFDNFEWADGYRERFGLVYVDYQSGQRIPKDSFQWYRRIIESRGRAALGDEALAAYGRSAN